MTSIRPATESDLDGLVDLTAALFEEDAGVHDPNADVTWPHREGRADLESLMASDDALVLAASSDGRVVGMLVGYTTSSSPTRQPVTYAILRSMYVVSAARRTGVATDLIDRFVEWARERGCAEAHVDHYAANEGASKLYEQAGFEERSITRVLPLNVTAPPT